MIRRKWSEVLVEEIDFRPHIDATNTEEKWRELAKDSNILVKVKTDSTAAQNNGEIEVVPCLLHSDIPIGILRSVSGDPTDFPKKFMVSVAVMAWDCNLDGSGDTGNATGALADTDFGLKIKPGTDGKGLLIKSGQPTNYTTGGLNNCRVIGGTHENLRLAFDFRDNFR